MTPLDFAARFGAALGLGLLLGLERERNHSSETESFAGARTLALVCLLGAAAADAQLRLGWAWILTVAFLAVTAIAVASYLMTSRTGDVGATTEIATLLTFVIGGLCGAGDLGLATALAVAILLLLSAKTWTHRFAARIETEDVSAVLKFAIITVIVLPLLPDQGYGPPPLDVLNPYKIWLMVVLISALNFASYVLVKVIGQEHGIALTGLLGGLVSSTAVTLSFSQRSRRDPRLSGVLTLGILVAWTVMFFRVLVIVAMIDFATARHVGLGIGLLGTVCLVACGWLLREHRRTETALVAGRGNPFELGEAVKFGFLFGFVLFLTNAARLAFGETGLYVAGGLAGLTDVDPIVLSMTQLSQTDPMMTVIAARAILIAVLANTLVKAIIAAVTGSAELRKRFLAPAAAILVAGTLVAVFLGR